MILSVAFFVVCVGSILGIWALNSPIVNTVSAPFNFADTALVRLSGGLERVNTRLDGARQEVAGVRQDVVQLGDNFEQNAPILTRISKRITPPLEPQLQSLNEGVTTIREAAASLNTILDLINTVRFGFFNRPDQTIIDRLGARVDDFEASVVQLLDAVNDRRVARIEGTATAITGAVDRVDNGLQQVQMVVSQLDANIKAVQASLARIKATLIMTINLLSVALAIMFGWLAASEVSLFQHARDWYGKLRGTAALPAPAVAPKLDAPSK